MAGTGSGLLGASPWYQTIAHAVVTTTSATTITDPWPVWNQTITSSTTSAIWTNWMLYPGTTNRGQIVRAAVRSAAPADAAESLRIRQQMHAHHEQVTLAKSAARDKARALLLQHLTDRQRIDLASNGYFELETIQPSGERRRYRIHRGRAGNVRRLDEQGREVRRYCIHPVIACPDEDTMLTQKLWLETQEELFLRTANAS